MLGITIYTIAQFILLTTELFRENYLTSSLIIVYNLFIVLNIYFQEISIRAADSVFLIEGTTLSLFNGYFDNLLVQEASLVLLYEFIKDTNHIIISFLMSLIITLYIMYYKFIKIIILAARPYKTN